MGGVGLRFDMCWGRGEMGVVMRAVCWRMREAIGS